MKKLGINIKTETDDVDMRKYPHTYNVVTTKENKKYLFDLQEDMRYIKAHLRTQRFGISMQKDDKEPIINRFELEQIDKKFSDITKWLLFGTVDFDFISEALLPAQIKNTDKTLCVGEMEYNAVIVPDCITLRRSTLEILEKFQSSGGKVIFAGNCPKYIEKLEQYL